MGPINLSDIYNCLERIDYSLLLKSLSPFVVYYLGEKNFKSYKLHKEFKTPRVVTIDLPPELTENSQIDEERLLKINFGDSVIKFAKNLIEKMSHADLTLLYHNLSTLNIVTKNLTLKSLLFNCITYGEYSISNNLIRLPNNDKNDAIIHELFHMASTFYRENDPTFFAGFSQKREGENRIGRSLNEGYTELLANRYSDSSKKPETYTFEKTIAKNLEIIIGQEKMETLYLKASLYGLVEELKKYADKETIIKFILDIDFLGNQFENLDLIPDKKRLVNLKLKSVNYFLLVSYIKKLKIEFQNKEIDVETFKEKLITFINLIDTSIVVNKRKYEFTNMKELVELLTPILDNFEISVNDEKFDIKNVSR